MATIPIPQIPVDEVLAAAPFPPPGRILGRSRRGQEIEGYRLGSGPLHVSLIGGCHADEPVGPAMLRRLVSFLVMRPKADPLLAAATWSIVPHVNPDGEERNAPWSAATLPASDHLGRDDRAYDLSLYLRHAVRELPGDDMEFGFPRAPEDADARPENLAVAGFLAEGAPFHLHASFHGMGFASGPCATPSAAASGRWGTHRSTSTAAERKVFIASTKGSPPAPIRARWCAGSRSATIQRWPRSSVPARWSTSVRSAAIR
jgi:hypothetical protein